MSSVARIKLPVKGIDQQTEDLLLWKDVKKTGIAFGGATAAFFLFNMFKDNILSLVTMGLSMLIWVMLAWSVIGGLHFVNRPPPPMPTFMVEGIQEAQIRNMVEKATPYINKVLSFAHRTLSGKDMMISMGVGAGMYMLARVFAAVSLVGLAYTAVVLVFSVPKIYEMYHDQIDGFIIMFRQKATIIYDAYFSKVLKMIPTAHAATPAESSSARKED